MSEQEDRTRAIVREEIAMAMQALAEASVWTEADQDALVAIQRTVERFGYRYPEDCRVADEARHTLESSDPFREPTGPGSAEAERWRVIHGATSPRYLPEVDFNALSPEAYKLLGNLARNDRMINAVVRLVQDSQRRSGA